MTARGTRPLVYLIATTVDGFIADGHGSADGFPQHLDTLRELFARYPETCPAHLRAHFGVTEERRTFDTVVMGARTHQPALDAGLTSAYPHLDQHVVTHRRDLPADDTVRAWSGDPVELVRDLKARPGRGIWLCGGADLAAQLAPEIDELHVKVYPVVFGHGIPLFRSVVDLPLALVSSEAWPGGVVLNVYRRAPAVQ
ncbi:MAG: dihydrofolate reductase family protein [Kineosporiaceae bacterium]